MHLFLDSHGLAFRLPPGARVGQLPRQLRACGPTEVCDAILLSMRARHACVRVPAPF